MPDSNRAALNQRLEFRLAYLDTSSWNYLAKEPDREQLIRFIQREKLRGMASVASVGEVLRTGESLSH